MRSRVRRALAARIAAAGLVCAALTGWWVLDHVIRVRDELGQAALAAAVAPEPLAAIATAEPHVLSARAQLNAVRPLAQPIAGLSRLLAGVPGVGPEARAVAALWTFADATTNLGSELVSVADLGLAAGSDGSITTALLHVAPSAQMHLEAASVSFAQAATARAELDKLSWPFEPFRGSLARWDVAAPQLDAALRTAASVTAAAPHVLGEDRPATYLVLAQSSDDLRATGLHHERGDGKARGRSRYEPGI